MYSTKKDSMTIQVQVHAWHKKTKTSTLLDSGATHNFIDTRAIKSLGLGTRLLTQPRVVHNVDGTINQAGTITRYCNLWIQQGEKTSKLGFFVANLGHDRIILGHPWFKTHNPTIDWTTNTLLGPKICITTAGYRKKSSTMIKAIASPKYIVDPSIPEYYHQHAQVFDEKASFRFPPAREEDHAITLKPGAPSELRCKVYPQTAAESEATRIFINEHLEKGYITESKSPYASPFFFRKKKDGKL